MALGKQAGQIVEEAEHPLLAKAAHWGRVQLSMIARVQNGFAFSSRHFTKEKGIPLIRIRDIDKTTTENHYNGEFEADYVVKKGDILIGMDGDFNVARWKGRDGLLNQRVCRIIPQCNYLDERFLFLCLQPYLDAINAETSSITVKHLSSRTVEEIPLPLPPLPEQHRIVAKIEALFSELDKGVEQLKTAQQQLKVYRKAVLKWAFEGKLTENWRRMEDGRWKMEDGKKLLDRIRQEREEQAKANGKKLKPIAPLTQKELAELPELPQGWVWVKIGDLFNCSYGLSESLSKTLPDSELDVPVIRIPNITEFGSLDLNDLKYFPLNSETKSKLMLKRGDVLFNWRNAPKWIGRSATFNQDGEYVNASFLLKLRPLSEGYSFFISYYLNYLRIAGYFMHRVSNAVNQANFNASMTAQIPVPFPSVREQQIIVGEIECSFSIIDAMEKLVNESLGQSDTLRQSILKKAFEGKLVPQDPNDEPASVLLERIKKEREQNITGKIKRGKNGKQMAVRRKAVHPPKGI